MVASIITVRRQPVDPQGSILDAAMRDRAVARRLRQPLQSIGEARLAVRHASDRAARPAARVVEPDVAGAESIAQVEQNRYLPEAVVILALGLQMTVPLRS